MVPPFTCCWCCPCRRRKGRVQELGGSIQPVAVDGCCSSSRVGSQLPAGNGLVSGWREGADLALQVQALRFLARGSAHALVMVWVLRVTLTLLLPHHSPPVALSLWMSPGATSMSWTCGCPRWLPQHMVQGSPCPDQGFWCFLPTSLGKVFARTQTGKTSSQASHHPSVPLRACL